MNTFTPSIGMTEYAQAHSAELIRQAHLANGGFIVTKAKHSRHSHWLTQRANATNRVLQEWIDELNIVWLGSPSLKS